MSEVTTYSPNATLSLFHKSDAFVRGAMGPFRSGKSVAMCMEILRRANLQAAWRGVRKTRWAVVRETYPELRSTTIRTWQDWVPEPYCHMKFDAPITGRIVRMLSDGTTLDVEVLFLALDVPADAAKLRGLEITGAWVNEAREIPKEIVDTLTARVGQFPRVSEGGCTWRGVFMDTNPPDDDHWWYKVFEEQKPSGWSMFRQPPAVIKDPKVAGKWNVNPNAENLEHLDGGAKYYERLLEAKTDNWIKVYLEGRYGATFAGKPVWPEYNDLVHVAKEKLKPVPGVPIQLGWDFGLSPAVVVCQLNAKGQLLVLAEYLATNIGIRNFITSVLRPALQQSWRTFEIRSCGDPAGASRSQSDEKTCFDELLMAGIPTEPASTNNFTARRECVAGFLSRMADGQPTLLLSPDLSALRKSLNGGYYFDRIQKPGEEIYRDEPNKESVYSHIGDALTYAALALDPVLNVRKRCPAVEPKGVKAKGWV